MKLKNNLNFKNVVCKLKESRFGDYYCRRENVYLKFTSLDPINFIRKSQNLDIIQFRSANEAFFKRLEAVFENPVAVLEKLVVPEEATAVLSHGDFYRNNILFKYKDNIPQEVKLIDFQTVRYADPAIDIVFFLHLNTTYELRQAHLDELLAIYHNTLLDCLHRMSGLSSDYWEDNVLSLQVLHKNVVRHTLYGYINSAMFTHLLLASEQELQEMANLKAQEKDEVIPSQEYLRRAVLLGGQDAMTRSVSIIREMAEMDQTTLFSGIIT